MPCSEHSTYTTSFNPCNNTGRYCHSSHFTDKNINTERLSFLPKVT